MATRAQITEWVEESLSNENLKDLTITITGGSEKDEGYLGDIVFVTVQGTNEKNEKENLHLVIKHAKTNEHLRTAMPVAVVFDNEMTMYTEVIPAFKEFQLEGKVDDIFDCVAKCYHSSKSGSLEFLVFENLKSLGYEQHDRKKPMNLFHCKAILEQYGKFHAISFAMRQQNKKKFDDLSSKLQNVYEFFRTDQDSITLFETSKKYLFELLEKNGEVLLLKKLSNILQRGSPEIMKEALSAGPQSVIIHGDCWCNNFLFKYQGTNKGSPSKVAIIDWQISMLASPVIDLSYFLYACCSGTELNSFEELLRFYYNSFSTQLTKLGSNPEELFSYDDLKRQWKKYSIVGLVNIIDGLRVFLCDKEDAPALGDMEKGGSFADMFSAVPVREETLLYDRMIAVVKHYFDSTDI
ncbi:hypothetical protein JTB14_031739 [Gonioctena quinquepunctata]|nr:hypothetical protein JTB14_031739 [Gonioctena quinquepunctata]